MTARIWELHAQRLDGAIRTTPDGEADVAGLVLSEKAYLLAVRDFRPHELVRQVRTNGPEAVAQRLVAHYASAEALAASGGRSLVTVRGLSPGPSIRRNDEVEEAAAFPGRL
ncbi:MAG: hypothetical protein IT303_01520 [Dehalococcoidia bacterium]|nr:hypothetical protein [Dehalococcoidia bacterium]